MKTAIKRNSNIELLRIFAMLGVILLHYNNVGIGGGFKYASGTTINYYTLLALEALCIGAVNLFLIISGYFMCSNNERSILKPIQLLAQVLIFHEIRLVVKVIMGSASFSWRSVITNLLPFNYYVVLYIVLYFLSPYINVVIHSISKKQFRILLGISMFLFSFWNTAIEAITEMGIGTTGCSTIGQYGSQSGYTIVNFTLMYLIGAYIKLYKEDFDFLKIKYGLLILLADIMVLTVWQKYDGPTARAYCNPLVILNAVVIFLIFLNLQVKDSRIIVQLAKGSFTVFLLHQIFLPFAGIEQFASGSLILLLIHIVITCVVIYLICYGLYWIYNLCVTPVFKILGKTVGNKILDIELHNK